MQAGLGELEDRSVLALSLYLDDARATLVLIGELDVDTVDGLTAAVAGLTGDGYREVILELSALEFCDARGLRAFVDAQRRLSASRVHLVLTGARPFVRQVIELGGLADELTLR